MHKPFTIKKVDYCNWCKCKLSEYAKHHFLCHTCWCKKQKMIKEEKRLKDEKENSTIKQ